MLVMVASKKHRAEKLPPSLQMGMMGIGVEPGWMELGAGWCLFTLLSMLVGFFVYFYAPSWKVRKVPGPPALPIVGHLPLLGKHGPDFPGVLAKTYGPIFRFHIGRQPIVVVSDAELCKEIGVKQFKIFRNRSLPSAITGFPLHSKGLFNSKDPRWSAMRNTIVSLYQPTHLASLIPIMQSYIAAAAERLARPANPQEDDILFSNFTLQLATDVLGEAAFGVDFGLSKGIPPPASSKEDDGDDEISEFIKAHIYATKAIKMDLSSSLSIIIGLIVPFLQEPFRRVLTWIPGMADRKIEQLNRSLSTRLDNIIAKRAMQKERGEKNFVSVILNARDSGQASSELFTPDYISALAYEHLLAGSTSTSFTMSSIVYLVSIHPEVEEKLIQEIDTFGPPDLVPTAEDLQHKFPYVDQVIKESMRFFTASPFVGREAMQQVKIGDYVLPKGTWVWMAPGIMVKDPKHFPEPHLFKPERFDPSGEEEKKRHPYAYFPFGIGPRSCIAQKYALQEIKLTVIHLYRNYVFRHSPLMENPLQLQYGIILYFKHGVRIHAIKRSKLN